MLCLLWTLANASVVDRVVLVVDDQLVLASDIALDEALAVHDPGPLPFWRRKTAERRQLEAAILRVAAGDIQLYQPDADASRRRLEDLRASFADRQAWLAFLTRWGLDEDRMRAELERRMRVERYLERNLQVPPTDRRLWNAACDALVTQLAQRIRIREVDPQ